MEDFYSFIGSWLRVRCGRIFLLLVLCSLLMVKTATSAESEFMCYQGKIITSNVQTISLSKKSLSNFSLKRCQAPTTAAPELMTTDILTTTLSDVPSTSIIPSTSISKTEVPETNSTTHETDITTINDIPTQMTTVNQVLTTIPSEAPENSSLTPAATTEKVMNTPVNGSSGLSNGRRRRSQDDDQLTHHEPSHGSNFTCQVFYYPTNKDDKLKVKSNHTLEFSCVTDDMCEGSDGTTKVTINGNTGTLYCCNGTACNSPLIVTSDEKTEVTVETLKNCSSYNEAGEFQSIPCVQTNTHMCLNVTDDVHVNDTTYTCGNMRSEDKYCMENNWYSEKCTTTEGITYCCYLEPTFVKVPPGEVKPPKSSVGIVIGIIVAFATGLFLGCMGLIILQKKCGKGRGTGMEMDFSYSRFQSADSGTDEL